MTLLYSLSDCPHSRLLRDRLRSEGTPFDEIDLKEEPNRMAELMKLTGRRRIVPVVVQDGKIQVAPDGGTEF